MLYFTTEKTHEPLPFPEKESDVLIGFPKGHLTFSTTKVSWELLPLISVSCIHLFCRDLHSHLRTCYKLEVCATPTLYLESWLYHLLCNLGKFLTFSCLSFFPLQSGKVTAHTLLITSHSTDYRNDSNYSDNVNKTYRELSRFQGTTIYIISVTQEPSGYVYIFLFTNFCLDDHFACPILQKLYLPSIIFWPRFFGHFHVPGTEISIFLSLSHFISSSHLMLTITKGQPWQQRSRSAW